MRILRVRLNNLNSLAGDWEIDFTDDTYTTDGIFAITGPTGSGKTTILDAICLALYGCTPRLKTISKSTNEIMHRRAAACSAEVEIATARGTYRCTWAQERARRKPDGALQNPHHEIADARTGTILTTRKREVPRLVEEVTGMDYERFTRSVMLAQGDFAAFLNATPDERSPLLEQITGTEIYSEISVRVHERRRDEQATLKELMAKSEGISLLSDEMTAALRNEEATLLVDGEALQEKIRRCREGLDWHHEGARIAKTLADTDREEADWTEQCAAAAESLSRLKRGEIAAACEGEFRQVTTLRSAREKERTTLAEREALLPGATEAARQAETALSNHENSLRDVREQADKAAPLLREVRRLDDQLQSGGARLRDMCTEEKRAVEEWEQVCADLHRWSEGTGHTPEKKEAVTWILQEHGIAEKYPSFGTEAGILADRLTAAVPGRGNDRSLPPEAENVCTILEKEMDALHHSFAHLEWYRDITVLRDKITACQERRTELMVLRDHLSDGVDDTQKLAGLTTRLERTINEYNELEQALATCTHDRERQERLTEQMGMAASLAARVRDLETERAHLIPGEPCPLCGSPTHPYADETTPLPRAAEEELKKEQDTLREIRKEEIRLRESISRCTGEAEGIREAQDDVRTRITHRKKTWVATCRKCGLNPDAAEPASVIGAALETTNETIKRHLLAETAIHVLKEEFRKTETLIGHCRQAVRRFGDVERCAQNTEKMQAELTEIRIKRDELLPDISPEEAEARFSRMIEAEKKALVGIEANYRNRMQETAKLEGEIGSLQESLKNGEEKQTKAEYHFEEVLSSAGFLGEEDFTSALLSPEERAALKGESERLDRWHAGIVAQRAAAQKEAEVQRNRPGTEKDEPTLTTELQALATAEQETNTRRGEIRQQLRRDAEERERYAEQQTRIAAQETETRRWDELHSLIGSADGKKFRNFAQGLTFAVMIASANRQLQTMSGRYLLKQHPERPLELEVMDNEQGGAIRSTKNLSGGESFLVSLAMALGLASMASGKIRVDSLFLDEGFGTLDEDALEMALSTLASLRDQGKTIGVISHVPALRERIGTVITVKKESGGRSTVKGPGVLWHGA